MEGQGQGAGKCGRDEAKGRSKKEDVKSKKEGMARTERPPDYQTTKLSNYQTRRSEEDMEARNEIVVYQPDETVRLEVRLDGETVWLTQGQMAVLFGCGTDNVGLHLKNIYAVGELSKEATTEEFSAVRTEGARRVRRLVTGYHLDAIRGRDERWDAHAAQGRITAFYRASGERGVGAGGGEFFNAEETEERRRGEGEGGARNGEKGEEKGAGMVEKSAAWRFWFEITGFLA